MSPIQQPTFIPATTVDIANATDGKITRMSLTLANTEYSHSLVSGLKQLRIRCENSAELQYSFTALESGTKYFSIYRGTCENLIDLDFTGKTLYVQSNKASVIIQIMELY